MSNAWLQLAGCDHQWAPEGRVSVTWPAGSVVLKCLLCGHEHTARFRLPRLRKPKTPFHRRETYEART